MIEWFCVMILLENPALANGISLAGDAVREQFNETVHFKLYGSELELATVNLVPEASQRHQSAGGGGPAKASFSAKADCCRGETR